MYAGLFYQRRKQISCVMRSYEPSMDKLRKTGVAVVDGEDRPLSMEENHADPKNHWCTPPFYIYKASDVGLVKGCIESGCALDAPGSSIARLSSVAPVRAFAMQGKRYDNGNLQNNEDVKQYYHGIDK